MDGRTVTLTAREFTMLETLMRHPGQVLSREQLLSQPSQAWEFGARQALMQAPDRLSVEHVVVTARVVGIYGTGPRIAPPGFGRLEAQTEGS